MAFHYSLTPIERARLALTKIICPISRNALRTIPLTDFIFGIYISTRYRYVYIDNPKTGCTSLKSAMAELELQGQDSDLNPFSLDVIHFDSSPLRPFPPVFPSPTLSRLATQGYRFVTFVRNPYQRLLSCYLDKFSKNPSASDAQARRMPDGIAPANFSEFIRAVIKQTNRDMDPHWRSQSVNIHYGGIPYTYIGRFEDYTHDYFTTFEMLGIPSSLIPTLRHLNKTDSGRINLLDYYNKENQDLVFSKYRNDFLNFGYPYEIPV